MDHYYEECLNYEYIDHDFIDYMDYKSQHYVADVDYDTRVAIERKWKVNKIRKIMKKKLLTIS